VRIIASAGPVLTPFIVAVVTAAVAVGHRLRRLIDQTDVDGRNGLLSLNRHRTSNDTARVVHVISDLNQQRTRHRRDSGRMRVAAIRLAVEHMLTTGLVGVHDGQRGPFDESELRTPIVRAAAALLLCSRIDPIRAHADHQQHRRDRAQGDHSVHHAKVQHETQSRVVLSAIHT
jgi:hypothetical protein